MPDDFSDEFEDDLSDNPTLDSISRLIGEELAVKLSCDFGGIRLHIPAKPGKHSPITSSVGEAAANKIAKIYADMRFYVPLSIGKHEKILNHINEGNLSIPQIAKINNCHERTVYRVKRSGKTKVALPLFD